MTPQEFKAWFEGFTDAMSAPPTAEQWEKIKARVSEIDGVAITYPVFIDRYSQPYPSYQPIWINPPVAPSPLIPTVNPFPVTCSVRASTEGQLMNAPQGSFDSCMAMFALGRIEAVA